MQHLYWTMAKSVVAGFAIPICALLADQLVGKKLSRWTVNLLFIFSFSIYFWNEFGIISKLLLGCLMLSLFLNRVLFGLRFDGFKDYIVAPIAEEFCYRKFIADYLLKREGRFLLGWTIFWSSFLFSSAHLVTLCRKNECISFKFGYTFLFSIAASLIYFIIPTGYNLFFAIVFHSFCNLIGIPAFRVQLSVVLGLLFTACCCCLWYAS